MKLEDYKNGMSALDCFRMRKRNSLELIVELNKTMLREEKELKDSDGANHYGCTAEMYDIQECLQNAYSVYNNSEE